MSEEQTKQTTEEQNPVHPETLQERVNKAYIANGYTLLNGGSDNILMINGTKGENKADILMTWDGAKEMVDQLESETKPKEEKSD
jgi:hypothetical protein